MRITHHAALTDTKIWNDLLQMGVVGAGFGFLGLMCGGGVEAYRSIRDRRPANWSEPTVYGTLLLGTWSAAIEGLHLVGVPFL
jgi:hypothetical protein